MPRFDLEALVSGRSRIVLFEESSEVMDVIDAILGGKAMVLGEADNSSRLQRKNIANMPYIPDIV